MYVHTATSLYSVCVTFCNNFWLKIIHYLVKPSDSSVHTSNADIFSLSFTKKKIIFKVLLIVLEALLLCNNLLFIVIVFYVKKKNK